MLGCLECSTTQYACTCVYYKSTSQVRASKCNTWMYHRHTCKNTGGEPVLIISLNYIVAFAYDMSLQCQWWRLNIQQLTRRYCSKFSVMPMSIWMSQNSSTVSPSVVYTGVVASCQATVPSCSICLYHVSVHLPTCLHWQSSWQATNGSLLHEVWQLLVMHMAIILSGCTWILGTRVRQTRDKWHILT